MGVRGVSATNYFIYDREEELAALTDNIHFQSLLDQSNVVTLSSQRFAGKPIIEMVELWGHLAGIAFANPQRLPQELNKEYLAGLTAEEK